MASARLSAVRLHLWLTVLWVALIVPTIAWWSRSILWVLLMSIWANAATHWGAYQAARAERMVREDGDAPQCHEED